MAYEPYIPLTDEQVLEMRRLYHCDKVPQRTLATKYRRAIGTIGRIVRGETHQSAGAPAPGAPAPLEAEVARSQKRLEDLLGKPGLPEELKPKIPNPYE